MSQNQQFEGAMASLKYARETLDPARLVRHFWPYLLPQTTIRPGSGIMTF